MTATRRPDGCERTASRGDARKCVARVRFTPNRIAEIVHNRRRISADTVLRLSLYFGITPEFWMKLEAHHDLKLARRALEPETAERIAASRVG